MPVPNNFSTVRAEYVILSLDLDHYRGTSHTLPAGFTFVGAPLSAAHREDEKRLLELNFANWEAPYDGHIKGWREDSPIFITYEGKLIAGLYACAQNEINDRHDWGQLHYFFVNPAFKGRGLHSVLFSQAVARARAWGLKGVYINTDRHGLPQLYQRWGAVMQTHLSKTATPLTAKPKAFLKKVLPERVIRFLRPRPKSYFDVADFKETGAVYWERRAEVYGRRAVLDIRHTDSEYKTTTQSQERALFPILEKQLDGTEKTILDFGCGAGRFTCQLAHQIGGRAVGVDPVAAFLDMAPTDRNVDYRCCVDGRIPLDDGSVDAIWIFAVLGGIPPEEVSQAIFELNRVLRAGGLLFLTENTSTMPPNQHWRYMSVREYQNLFPHFGLSVFYEFFDFGQRFSVMAGRKPASV